MSGTEDVKDHEHVEGEVLEDSEKAMPSPQQEVVYIIVVFPIF